MNREPEEKLVSPAAVGLNTTVTESPHARNERLQEDLRAEREGAARLRRALELAATYFHAPLNNAQDAAAWEEILSAIRSAAGRNCPCCGQSIPADCRTER